MKPQPNQPLKILISAYACGPNWGSEIGMGWHWVIHLSKYCQLFVITESAFKEDIEKKLPELKLVNTPIFYYNDIGDEGRRLFWKQGSFLFYKHYKKWQENTLKIAKEIIKDNDIDIVHQLNMIGYREPGFLWQIEELPFIWGPVGGFNQMPNSYLVSENIKNIYFYTVKNLINAYQKRFTRRVQKCAKRADILIAATAKSKVELDKISNKNSYLMGETGCELTGGKTVLNKSKSKVKILWVGRLQALKALPIALKTLSVIKEKISFEFVIIGDGPDEHDCKKLAKDLGIDKQVAWLGRIPNNEVVEHMKTSNIFFFTSLKEGTPHVITEAIQNGLPVVCHDACGHGTVINDSCGLKIPMIDKKTSIKLFSEAVLKLSLDFELQEILSKGAIKRAQEVTWDAKANEMLALYNSL